MTVGTATRDAVHLAYETIGPESGEPMLLLPGMGGQLLDWSEGFCAQLVAQGFHVARMDNRDSGLSTRFTEAGRPNQLTMLLRPAAGRHGRRCCRRA